MNLYTRNPQGITWLRAAEFEGGLNPPCSRLGTLPTGELAALALHAKFEGGHRRLGLVTVPQTGHVIVWLRVLRRATLSSSGRWTTTLTVWRRKLELVERRAAHRLLIAWRLFADESLPEGVLPVLRRARPCPLYGLATGSATPPPTPPRGSPTTTSQCLSVAAIAT